MSFVSINMIVDYYKEIILQRIEDKTRTQMMTPTESTGRSRWISSSPTLTLLRLEGRLLGLADKDGPISHEMWNHYEAKM